MHSRKNEGSPDQIEILCKTIQDNVKRLSKGPNEKSAKTILRGSVELSQKYLCILLNHLESSFRANIEQDLWRNCFYSTIEALKKQSANSGPHSDVFRDYLIQLIDQAIEFYQNLIEKYEVNFEVDFGLLLRWPPEGFPPGDLAKCSLSQPNQSFIDTMILRSAQRHVNYLGDLYRYKTQNTLASRKDYRMARKYYFVSHSLEPMNGHPFNQLAVVSSYEKKWIDVVYFYTRALSVRYPFEPARESLEMAFNNLRGTSQTFEKWIWERNENKPKESTSKRALGRGPRSEFKPTKNFKEVWFHHMRDQSVGVNSTNVQQEGFLDELFSGDKSNQVQRKAIGHLLHCSGILISNIGMDQFKRSSMLALEGLSTFVSNNDTILSPQKILKIIISFIFPVHSSKTGASDTIVFEQKSLALEMMIRIMGKLLAIICRDLENIGLFLLTGILSGKFARALPSLCVILTWICKSSLVQQQIVNQSDKDQLFCWKLLSLLCNKLYELQDDEQLAECTISHFENDITDSKPVELPEFFFVSPFFDNFSAQPIEIFVNKAGDVDDDNMQSLAVHARFSLILRMTEQLAEDEHFPLIVSAKDQNEIHTHFEAFQFVKNQKNNIDLHESCASSLDSAETQQTEKNDEEIDNYGDIISEAVEPEPDESELKKKLLFEEEVSMAHQWIIEIRPKYLVPDTNTFIDHLGQIRELVYSKHFVVLVPTIVIDELRSLSMGVPISGSTLLSRELLNPEGSQVAFVMQRAKEAVDWLRESADNRTPNLSTVTTNGNIIQKLSFAIEDTSVGQGKSRSNDDRILSVCINLCERLSRAGSTFCSTSAEMTRLERIVVLLTEDRGLSAKAIAEKIPVRTVPCFTQWAVEKDGQATVGDG